MLFVNLLHHTGNSFFHFLQKLKIYILCRELQFAAADVESYLVSAFITKDAYSA